MSSTYNTINKSDTKTSKVQVQHKKYTLKLQTQHTFLLGLICVYKIMRLVYENMNINNFVFMLCKETKFLSS